MIGRGWIVLVLPLLLLCSTFAVVLSAVVVIVIVLSLNGQTGLALVLSATFMVVGAVSWWVSMRRRRGSLMFTSDRVYRFDREDRP